MFSLNTAFIAATLAVGVLAGPVAVPAAVTKRNTPNSSGINNGYFYQFCMYNTRSRSEYSKS